MRKSGSYNWDSQIVAFRSLKAHFFSQAGGSPPRTPHACLEIFEAAPGARQFCGATELSARFLFKPSLICMEDGGLLAHVEGREAIPSTAASGSAKTSGSGQRPPSLDLGGYATEGLPTLTESRAVSVCANSTTCRYYGMSFMVYAHPYMRYQKQRTAAYGDHEWRGMSGL